MSYTNPEDVIFPQGHLSSVDVIYDGGEGSYAVANIVWDGHETVGIRWNGGCEGPFSEGNPHSRGFPTWFVLPDEIAEIVKQSVLPR
jgi:hypothetical protein